MAILLLPYFVPPFAGATPPHSNTPGQSLFGRGPSRPIPVVWDAPMCYQQYLSVFHRGAQAVASAAVSQPFPNSGISVTPPASQGALSTTYAKLRRIVHSLLTVPAANFVASVDVPTWTHAADLSALAHYSSTFPSIPRQSAVFDRRQPRLSTSALLSLFAPDWMLLTRGMPRDGKLDMGYSASLLWPAIGVPYAGRGYSAVAELDSFLDAVEASLPALKLSVADHARDVASIMVHNRSLSRRRAQSAYYRKHVSLACDKPGPEYSRREVEWHAALRDHAAPVVIEDVAHLFLLFWALHTPLLPPNSVMRGGGVGALSPDVPMPPDLASKAFGPNAFWCNVQSGRITSHILGAGGLVDMWAAGSGEPYVVNRTAGCGDLLLSVDEPVVAAELRHAVQHLCDVWQRRASHDTDPRRWPGVKRVLARLDSVAGRAGRVLTGSAVTWAPPVAHIFDRIADVTPVTLDGELPGVLAVGDNAVFPTAGGDVAVKWED